MEGKTEYFEKPGVENTDAALALARDRAKELGIKTILVASTSGKTAVRAMDVFKGLRVIIVTQPASSNRIPRSLPQRTGKSWLTRRRRNSITGYRFPAKGNKMDEVRVLPIDTPSGGKIFKEENPDTRTTRLLRLPIHPVTIGIHVGWSRNNRGTSVHSSRQVGMPPLKNHKASGRGIPTISQRTGNLG